MLSLLKIYMKNLLKSIKTIWWRIKSITAIYYYGNPSSKLKVVGVTGTNGKTTTATLLYKISRELGHKAGLISTVENIINGRIVEHGVTPTTPDSIGLTKLFYQMVKDGCEYVFMEVSSHALDQNRVLGINFTGGIFTNLTQDHLDYHKSMENYFNAKKKFFKMIPEEGFAISNIDDEHGKLMLDGIKAKKYTYGFEKDSDFKGEIVKLDFFGFELKISLGDQVAKLVKTKLVGKFNTYNILAVWSACKLLCFDMDKVNKILENITPPSGRFQNFTAKNGVLVIVDYAHTPDALENVLSATQKIKTENTKIISVFGCGGDRDPLKRPIMGKIGAINSDIAIFTSDNPRSEDPDKIIEQMKEGLSSEDLKKVKTIPNRHEAILESVKLAHSGDIILVAGKGHEDYQIIKGVKSHFDDMEELKKAFQ